VSVPQERILTSTTGPASAKVTRGKGFGFVKFDDAVWAQQAIDVMDQAMVGGRRIKVKPARHSKPVSRPSQPQMWHSDSTVRSPDDDSDSDDYQHQRSSTSSSTSTPVPVAKPGFDIYGTRSTGMPATPPSSRTTAMVANLAHTVSCNRALRNAFSGFDVVDAVVATHEKDRRPMGFGFVLFRNHTAMMQAIALMNGVEIDYRPIVMTPSTTDFMREKVRYVHTPDLVPMTSTRPHVSPSPKQQQDHAHARTPPAAPAAPFQVRVARVRTRAREHSNACTAKYVSGRRRI
jgi:hypothetical protein